MKHEHSLTRLEVDLRAIADNYNAVKERAAEGVVCACVVKADSYGLGAQRISQALYEEGCRNFFVATLDEGLALRDVLPGDADIAVFNGFQGEELEMLLAHNITPVINTPGQRELLQQRAVQLGRQVDAILHIDTGMNRLGLDMQQARQVAGDASLLDGVRLKYIMTHLACININEHELNALQAARIRELRDIFPSHKLSVGNSISAFEDPVFQGDMIRIGAALYGIGMTDDVRRAIRPVVRFVTRVINVRHIRARESVGYGARAHADAGTVLGVVPVGYADLYPWDMFGNVVGHASGICVKIVGRPSMDMLVFDITHLPGEMQREGLKIELIGAHYTLADLASEMGTIGYEVLTRMGPRVKRVYV